MSTTEELLATELRDLRKRIAALESVETPRRGAGTAFPTGIGAGHEWFRTDLGMECYYDGTRWLSVHEYECDLQPFALNPLPYSTAAVNALLVAPSRSDKSYYIVRARAYVYVNTTNNGSNYWGFELRDDNVTSLWAFNTSAGAPGENLAENAAINTVAAVSNYLTLTATVKTGAPGSIGALHCTVWYRLIVT